VGSNGAECDIMWFPCCINMAKDKSTMKVSNCRPDLFPLGVEYFALVTQLHFSIKSNQGQPWLQESYYNGLKSSSAHSQVNCDIAFKWPHHLSSSLIFHPQENRWRYCAQAVLFIVLRENWLVSHIIPSVESLRGVQPSLEGCESLNYCEH
jgi:hypothetical protein